MKPIATGDDPIKEMHAAGIAGSSSHQPLAKPADPPGATKPTGSPILPLGTLLVAHLDETNRPAGVTLSPAPK